MKLDRIKIPIERTFAATGRLAKSFWKVMLRVFGPTKNTEIFWPVVQFVSVHMMHQFIGTKFPSGHFFSDESMFGNVGSVHANHFISAPNRKPAFPSRVFFKGACALERLGYFLPNVFRSHTYDNRFLREV